MNYSLTPKQEMVLQYYLDEDMWYGDANDPKQVKNFFEFHTQWIVNLATRNKISPENININLYDKMNRYGEINKRIRHTTKIDGEKFYVNWSNISKEPEEMR